MIHEIFDEIEKEQNVRQNLIKLKQELKDDNNLYAFLFHYSNHCGDVLIPLLKNKDSKIRKNTALIMGAIGQKLFMEPLMAAYREEKQLFVKSSYLKALNEFDYREYLPELKKHLNVLTEQKCQEENKKHIQEEIRLLSDMILTVDGFKMHKFIGFYEKKEIILLTNRDHIDVTLKQLKTEKTKVFNAGIIAQTENIPEIMNVRTFEEMLFMVPGVRSCKMDVLQTAKVLASNEMLQYLEESHNGTFPFHFRIEMKSHMPLDKKSLFLKRLAGEIEQISNRKLINSTSHYEIEFRLIENKEGKLNILLKLFTLTDERFTYRKESVSTSIRPVNAALTMELAKKYMKEDAQVLDPFCGVGTMLIERHKKVRANTSFGIDIFGEAIEKAKINTETAHQLIHYVNKDFFDFNHEYLFDEIISDMPFAAGKTSLDSIKALYHNFFVKAKLHLKPYGVLILYSHNKEFIQFGRRHDFCILEQYDINRREGTCVNIMKKI